MATIASSTASPISISPSRRSACSRRWPCTTVCATSPGDTVSAMVITVAQNARRGSSQPDDAWAPGDSEARASVSESATAASAAARSPDDASTAPDRSALVLIALILVAAVANLNLAVANVALPDIGKAFDSSQTALNLIAVGYSLGLAASVLYFGAIGDRYGRKLMLLVGTALAIPASLLAAWAPSDEVLFGARVLGGLSAGMAFPTTLALITALWSGPGRTKSIAIWAATGGALSALGPLCAGILLEHFWWGSVFLLTLPLAAIALVMAVVLVPSHINETTEPVDHVGGVLSIALVGALILGINFAAVPNETTLIVSLFLVSAAALVAFYIRQRRAQNPLYDLEAAARPPRWCAACAR